MRSHPSQHSHRSRRPHRSRHSSGDRAALSLIEVVLATLIIGISLLPVLTLVRASTVSLEVSEVDVVARTFAGDVLERFAGPPPVGFAPVISPRTRQQLAAPLPADLLLASDPYLARGYPREKLEPILRRSQATVTLSIDNPPRHPALRNAAMLDCVRVTVRWLDAGGRPKEVSLARFVSH